MVPYRFPPRREQTDAERRQDMLSWKMLGHSGVRGAVLCEALHDGNYVCSEWGNWRYHDGKRYCGHHAPHGSERIRQV